MMRTILSDRTGPPALRLLVVAVIAVAAAVSGAAAEEPAPSVTVLGSGSASGRPDTAEVTAGVVTQAPTAAQAVAQNSAAVERVLKAVTALGIPERDIQTASVSVLPQRSQPRPGTPQAPEIVGYEVANHLRVKVRDLTMLGRLLDLMVGQGANALGGIAFSIADPGPLLQQARAKAVEDARQKALAYTAAAGVKLGRVLFIREAAPGLPRPMIQPRMMAADVGVPVAPGEQQVEVSVTITYAIE